MVENMKKLIVISVFLIRSLFAVDIPDGGEFTRLRLDFAKLPAANLDWIVSDERKALLEVFPLDKARFVDAGSRWLEKCPVDAKVQVMMAVALGEIGRPREALAHRYFHYGLMQSIFGPNDGLSKASAFKVISIDEEYTVCNFLGAKVLGQRLDGSFDVISVQISGAKKDLYFDITIPLQKTRELLSK